MSNFEIFIVVVILFVFGLYIAMAFLEAVEAEKDKESVKVNIERCEKCIYCKMSDYSSDTVFCEKVGKGEFITPCENCKYYRISEEKTLGEMIVLYEKLLDDFGNEV